MKYYLIIIKLILIDLHFCLSVNFNLSNFSINFTYPLLNHEFIIITQQLSSKSKVYFQIL